MRQIRINKRRTHSADWQQEPLRLDPRDPTALIVGRAATGGPRKLAPAQLTVDGAQCRALFASSLQQSDAPGADVVTEAIRVTVQQLGAEGCTGRMAQEFGDHPEVAAARMHWVRSLLI